VTTPSTVDDNEAVRTLVAQYCLALDAADFEAWVDLFTADGVLDLGAGEPPIAGRDALLAFGQSLGPRDSMHFPASPVIEVDGDTATCSGYVLVVKGDSAPRISMAGRYDDQLRRVEGCWRLAERRLTRRFQLQG
jgi:ketosteroid isomerase-like protein